MIENKYNHIQTNTNKKQREEMKAYAPSDRGTTAAVVVSQELLTAAVTGLQPTKEREKGFDNFFCLPNIFLDSNDTTKKRKSINDVLFLYLFWYHSILCYMSILGKRLRQ